MDDVGKFYADGRKCLRLGGTAEDAAALFLAAAPALASLPDALSALWLDRYGEDPEAGLDWLADALSFLRGTPPEGTSIPESDWAEIHDAVNAEAEDLPLDALESMMQAFVAKGLV